MITPQNEQVLPHPERLFYWNVPNGLHMVTAELAIETRVVLLPVDPYLVHAYWEIAAKDLEPLQGLGESLSNRRLMLRVYEVSDPDKKKRNPVIDSHLPLHTSKCYVPLSQPDRSYVAEIGVIADDGQFISVVESNVIQMPRAWPVDPLVSVRPAEKHHPFLGETSDKCKGAIVPLVGGTGDHKVAMSLKVGNSLSFLNESAFNTGIASWPNGSNAEDNGCNDHE